MPFVVAEGPPRPNPQSNKLRGKEKKKQTKGEAQATRVERQRLSSDDGERESVKRGFYIEIYVRLPSHSLVFFFLLSVSLEALFLKT